jgi:hypothetical protein
MAALRGAAADLGIRRAWSRQDDSLYSRKRNNELTAASRALRVRTEFPRFFSRCSRKARTSGASSRLDLRGLDLEPAGSEAE